MTSGPSNTAALVYDWNEKDRRGPLLRKRPRFVDADDVVRHGRHAGCNVGRRPQCSEGAQCGHA